jgi:hypothetical protein
MGTMLFVDSFVVKMFQKNLNTIASLPMHANPKAPFVMLLFHYVQHPTYSLHVIFLSLGTLQYYVKFDLHTMVTLEKLLKTRIFVTMVGI